MGSFLTAFQVLEEIFQEYRDDGFQNPDVLGFSDLTDFSSVDTTITQWGGLVKKVMMC